MFLDEPTTGLDPEYRFRFWEYLRRYNSRGMTVVATTHYMEEAREYCDKVLLMNEGKVAAYGPPERLIAESGLEAREPAAIFMSVVLPLAIFLVLGFSVGGTEIQVPTGSGVVETFHVRDVLLTHLWLGGTWGVETTVGTPIWVSFAYLGGLAAVCVAASVRLFQWD